MFVFLFSVLYNLFIYIFEHFLFFVFSFQVIVFFLCVNCVSLSSCQHRCCTQAQIVRTPSNTVTSALAQVVNKKVIHDIE